MVLSTEKDLLWIKQALDLARLAQKQGEVPVGAIVVLNDEAIGKGWNQPIATSDPTAHAEIIALRQAAASCQNYRIPNSTLYVTLEPCMMCIGAILQARVQRVVFGAFDPKCGFGRKAQQESHTLENIIAGTDSLELNHSIQMTGGILIEECAALLRNFFQQKRENKKIKYDEKQSDLIMNP